MKKRRKIILLVVSAVVISLAAAFAIYVSDYYPADDNARAILQNSEALSVQDNLIILAPETDSGTALIFYPGAKVEYTAYLPILDKIRQNCGITCILVKMPFNLAIFNTNAANAVIRQFPDIKSWYVGGHSMGGAMASAYASGHPNQVEGLILLGAYLYGDYPAARSLTIYGEYNTAVAGKVDYTDNVVVIAGGNHAQFGNYGPQDGDAQAAISADEQQNTAVAAIQDFINQ